MATKDCTFFVDINGRQVEMDFDGFRAYLMQDGVMATLAPDLTAKRGKKAGFTVTAQKAEPTPARAEAPTARAEGTTKKTEAPAPTELEVSAENLRKLMPKLGKRRAEAIIAVMKAMGIPFDRLKLAKGKVEGKLEGESFAQEAYHATKGAFAPEPGFPNGRFRLDKIGTGTGRAFEGYGIYFAQIPRTAGKYYDKFIKTGYPAVLYKLDIPDSIMPKLFNRERPLPLQVFTQLADAAKKAGRTVRLNPEMTLAQLMKVLGEDAAGTQLLESAGVLGATIPKQMFGGRGTIDTYFTYLIWSQSALDKIALLEANNSPLQQIQQGKETLQQADTKARDAEYMAAVKAGDTSKAQKMVEEAAKAAGYTEKAYHATNRQFTIFNADAGRYTYPVTSPKAIYFTSSKEEASFWADVKSQSSGQPIVLPVYLRPSISSRYPKPVQRVDAGGVPADQLRVSRTNADMIILENIKEFGGDALVTDYVVFSPNQIKSADPITYDNKGNVIPLSERFKPESPDIRYQKEASPLGSITFIDDLNALISVFEKANFSTVIHEAMHFYRRHMLNTANGFTAEEIKRFERWAGAKDGKWTVAAEEKAARAFEKYLRDGLAPIPELRDLFRRVAQWMREVYATLTGSPVDIDIPTDIRQVFDRIFTLEAERRGRPMDTSVTKVERDGKTLYQTDVAPEEGPVFVDNIIEGLKTWAPKGTPEQLKAHLVKIKGAVAEANWIGLPLFLEGRKSVTRDEVAQFVRDNQLTVREVLLSDEPAASEKLRTLYSDYVLKPKAPVYRELLFLIPPQASRVITSPVGSRLYDPQLERATKPMSQEEAEGRLRKRLAQPVKQFVNREHYPRAKNSVVHARFNERVLGDGSKVLFIEEIQSDWAQAKRQKNTPLSTPFQDTPRWTMLAFKRMLRWATDNGYDKIAWTTGTQQAERWSGTVSQAAFARTDVEKIDYEPAGKGGFSYGYDAAVNLIIHTADGKVERYKNVSPGTIAREFGAEVMLAIPFGSGTGSLNVAELMKEKAAQADVLRTISEMRLIPAYSEIGAVSYTINITYQDGTTKRQTEESYRTIRDLYGAELAEYIDRNPAPEIVITEDVLTSLREPESVSGTTQAMLKYYDQIIPTEVAKYVKPLGGKVTREPLETGQRVHVVTVTDEMRKLARQGQTLFQREGEGVPQAETATAAYRRAMKERQQERAAKALRRLGQKKGEPATLVPAQPRPSLEITPVNRRAVIETMQELREFKRKLTEQKGGLAAATDADLDKWEKLLNRIEQLGGVNPITPQMDAKYQAVIDAGVVGKRGQTVQAALDKAASTAFGVPEVTRVPDTRKWRAVDWEEEIDWQEDRVARRIVLEELELTEDDVDWNDIREKDVYILGFQDPDVWNEWDWDDIPDDARQPTLLAYPRVKIAGKEDAIGELVHEYMILQGEERAGEGAPPAPLPLEVETGKPIVAQVFRGGTFEGTEFQSQFLGKLTNAQSARMGYFFAATPQTANVYTREAVRRVSPRIADSVATPATRPYYVYMSNPLVHDNEGSERRTVPLPKLIKKALKDGHDGVIVKNIYDPLEDHLFIVLPGHENQIKSAEPETSDSRGNLIPLSERFNPTTKNVLYQGEDPLPNPEGTSTEAFRRKQAEQRQKNLIDAMNRLRQGQAQAPKGEQKAAQPKAAKEPSQARQGQTRAPRAARTAASTPRRGFGGKSLDDIFDALLKQAKAGQLGVSKEAPATPSELLEERIKRGLRDVLDAVYNKRVQPESAVDTARNAAANLLAAHQAGEQSAIDAATAEFRQVVSESRKAARGPQAPRPPRPKATVAERYAKMMGRINEKPKPAAKATPAELAEMTVRQLLRRMEKQLKVAKSQGIDVEQMEVNGATVSRKEFFVNAADEYQDAYVKQDVPRQQAAYDRMRMAVDTIVTSLQKGKSRPLWHGLRSPLSYANVIGSYEGVMGQLGAEISELFKRTRTDINNKVMTFSEGMSFLQEQMNKVYKPLMKAQGYYGMPAIIDEHIKYLRFTAAFSARYTKIRKEQSIFKDPKAWYTTRRELSRELIDGQSAAFPMAAAMIKSVVYTAKLKYNLKSASTNYISLALSVGPYMRANELADIIYEAAKPSTWNRKVAGDRTLRDVAVGETGGRQAEGAPADEGLTHWWHRKDIFQLSSEHVRIAGYLVGERMAEREDQKLRAEGKAPLSDYVKARLIRDWIEKVEFDNSPWNIAPWFRGPKAGIVLQFKPFLQKNVERFIADLQRDPEAFVLSDPRTPLGQITNKIPWKYRRVIGTIGQQVMWGGIGSLLTAVPYLKPLAGVFILAGLMNALKGMTDDDEFAEDLAIGIYYGAPAAIGVDLSSSLGFFEEAYGKTIHEQVVNFTLGPFVGTVVNVAQKQYQYWEAAQKEPRLGGEEEKRKELMRRGIDIAKQVTPYVRMLESAVDLAQGEGSTMRLDKEEKLTTWETAIRALGGAPLKQTMFFDEKEAYGWQKSLLGKPTGFERLKKKEGESDASYFRRKAKTDQWERTYLRRLEQNPRYKRLKPEEQEAVRENLWRNFAEESGKLRPDTSKFDASGLLERRAERVRSR